MVGDSYSNHTDATPLLGQAGRCMYSVVRHDMGVSFLREATLQMPKPERADVDAMEKGGSLNMTETSTTSSLQTRVYEAMRCGCCIGRLWSAYRALNGGRRRDRGFE